MTKAKRPAQQKPPTLGRTGRLVCGCGKGYASLFDGKCYTCRGGITAWEAQNPP